MKRIQLLTLLSLLFIAKTHGQFLAAAVNLKDSSSLSGFVKKFKYYPGANEILLYSQKKDKNPKLILPETIAELVVEGRGSFIFEKVKIYTHELNVANSLPGKEIKETSLTKSVFLKILLIGEKLTLYSYKDGNRINYFIQKPGGQIITLRYLRTIEAYGVNSIKEYRYYLQELLPYVSGNEKLEEKLEMVEWNEKDMVTICKAINANTTAYALYKGQPDEREKITYFLGAGVNVTKYEFDAPNEYVQPFLDKMKFNLNIMPVLMFGSEISFGKKVRNLQLENIILVAPVLAKGNTNWGYANYTAPSTFSMSGISLILAPVLKFDIVKKLSVGIGLNLRLDLLKIKFDGFPTWINEGIFERLNADFYNDGGTRNKTFASIYPFCEMKYRLTNKHSLGIVFSPRRTFFKAYDGANLKFIYATVSYIYHIPKKSNK